jgi:hypothetical protein
MKPLDIGTMKKITAGSDSISYDGCNGDYCCISFKFPNGGSGQVCGSMEWYFSY